MPFPRLLLPVLALGTAGGLGFGLQPPVVSLSGPARAIDGDTIEIAGARVRLLGIDAPERDQPCRRDGADWACGEAAREALARHIAGSEISCRGRSRDRWGRLVARCTAGAADIGRWMIERGWAIAYGRPGADYALAEASARDARRGMWSGEFEPPSAWRKAHPLEG